MTVRSIPLQVETKGGGEIENLTDRIGVALKIARIHSGTVTIFVKHTTASVMIIEDEPGIRADTVAVWERLVPKDTKWQHNIRNVGENNGHSHLRGQIQGQSVTVPFNEGALSLGRWQQIVLVDFDTSPRKRDLILQFLGE